MASTKNQIIEQIRHTRDQLAQGKKANASEIYEYAYEQAGDDHDVNFELGLLCLQDEIAELAVKHFRVAVEGAPEDADRLGLLGCALQMHNHDAEAFHVLRKALDAGNDDPHVTGALGIICLRHSDFGGACDYLERALERNPKDPNLNVGMARALSERNEHEKALPYVRKAIDLGAANEYAYFVLGRVLSEIGRLDEAVDQLEGTIRKYKTFGPAYHALTSIKKFSEDDYPFIRKAEKVLDQSMPSEYRLCLHFALASMYEGCKDWDAAFEHCKKGNLMQKAPNTAKGLNEEARFQKMFCKYMSRSTLKDLMKLGHESREPVFVVGMPRSGTTLIESIIATHPLGAGAGELPEMMRIRQELVPYDLNRRGWVRVRKNLTESKVREYAEQYLGVLRQGRADADRIVDKRPGNFIELGLIAMLFPNATIINAVRHPLDVAVSCYFQRFTDLPWANDFREIAKVYAMYRKSMAHWKKVLPEGQIVDVHYENLVQDQENEARRLLDACGLEWDDSVLDFHKREGVVRTASIGQVRQPIYDSSRMRWVRYAPHLGEVASELLPWLPESADELEELGVPIRRSAAKRWLSGIRR